MDNSTSCVLGIPLKEDVVGYFGDVRKDLGRSSASRMVSALDRKSIRRL